MEGQAIDPLRLRRALGAFATGVALVTARDPAGRVIAITVNSFSPVSLDPPLVLWSLRRESARHEAFMECDGWVVNVLQAGQQPIARRHAARDGLHADEAGFAPGRAPVLAGALASFECRRHSVIELGDHSVLVGRIVALDTSEGEPLVFHAGRFGGSPAELAAS